MKVIFRYKVTHVKTSKVSYFKNSEQLGNMLRIGRSKAVKLAKNGDVFNFFKLEELHDTITIDVPKKDELVTIEGVECRVINVYDRTFSVKTADGNRLVKIDSMSFVDSRNDIHDRTMMLKRKSF